MTWHTALHMKSKTLRDGSESPIKNVQIAAKQTEKNKSSSHLEPDGDKKFCIQKH